MERKEPGLSGLIMDVKCACTLRFKIMVVDSDMFVDPEVGSMIPEDLSTKCSIGSMIQSDPTIKFDSRSWDPIGSLNNFWDWISDLIGSLMELVVSDL